MTWLRYVLLPHQSSLKIVTATALAVAAFEKALLPQLSTDE